MLVDRKFLVFELPKMNVFDFLLKTGERKNKLHEEVGLLAVNNQTRTFLEKNTAVTVSEDKQNSNSTSQGISLGGKTPNPLYWPWMTHIPDPDEEGHLGPSNGPLMNLNDGQDNNPHPNIGPMYSINNFSAPSDETDQVGPHYVGDQQFGSSEGTVGLHWEPIQPWMVTSEEECQLLHAHQQIAGEWVGRVYSDLA